MAASSDTVRLHSTSSEGKEPTVSIGFSRLATEAHLVQPLLWTWTYNRQMIVVGVVLVAAISLVSLFATVIALRAQLNHISTNLQLSEGKVPKYESIISNLTSTFTDENCKLCDAISNSRSGSAGAVYFRWGVPTCPSTAQLIYPGVTASSSILTNGGGSNHLCMTPKPDFLSPMRGRQTDRSYIYGTEYRGDYEPLKKIHGHNAPCAACLSRGRSTLIMVPGSSKCPETGNWTREYFGYLMAARKRYYKTTYICVDVDAETIIGSVDEYQNGGLLYPVEGYCNTHAGGGLPCGPYVDGYELTCAVCTI